MKIRLFERTHLSNELSPADLAAHSLTAESPITRFPYSSCAASTRRCRIVSSLPSLNRRARKYAGRGRTMAAANRPQFRRSAKFLAGCGGHRSGNNVTEPAEQGGSGQCLVVAERAVPPEK